MNDSGFNLFEGTDTFGIQNIDVEVYKKQIDILNKLIDLKKQFNFRYSLLLDESKDKGFGNDWVNKKLDEFVADWGYGNADEFSKVIDPMINNGQRIVMDSANKIEKNLENRVVVSKGGNNSKDNVNKNLIQIKELEDTVGDERELEKDLCEDSEEMERLRDGLSDKNHDSGYGRPKKRLGWGRFVRKKWFLIGALGLGLTIAYCHPNCHKKHKIAHPLQERRIGQVTENKAEYGSILSENAKISYGKALSKEDTSEMDKRKKLIAEIEKDMENKKIEEIFLDSEAKSITDINFKKDSAEVANISVLADTAKYTAVDSSKADTTSELIQSALSS